RLINAIIDWSSNGPQQNTSYEAVGVTKYQIEYIPYKLVDDFYNQEMSLFNDLLCKMLNVDSFTRINIDSISSHPFFEGLNPVKYITITRSPNNISNNERIRVIQYIQRYSQIKKIQNLAFNIYIRCNNMNNISEHIRSATCTWIASKMIIGSKLPTINFPINQLLSTERDICHNLSFRLNYS